MLRSTFLWIVNCIVCRVLTGQGKLWKMSGNLSGQGKVRGKYFLGKARENEKFVPPDVTFSGLNASNSIFARAPAQTQLGELTVLPQTL